ncbi:hypothetical protein TSARBOMBA_245 [Bacillus phage TsarBomba]|uniref:Uncharacterized protein n=1 Tax=Bacillus phage TsarBomba TaxID=1690456 RepID=A0A0K2D042_9CAUD|nr:hypothetical protein TSARBOMBA_245 [Bacillus phage TsarBomba]ALA13115.1 hypothetical protein TSARBOMBA_245 [Bacillus phage TsarBomba]
MRKTRKKAAIRQTIRENYKALHKLHDQEEHNMRRPIMKHYLCFYMMGLKPYKSFIVGKVYSAYEGKEPSYMVFTDEFGEKHPIAKEKLKHHFREVQMITPEKYTLPMQLEWLKKQEEKIARRQMNPHPLMTEKHADDMIAVQSLIPVIEKLMKEAQTPPTVEEPVKVQILSVEEYDGMMGQLDQLKHTGQLKQIGYTQVRAMITELYKRQEN